MSLAVLKKKSNACNTSISGKGSKGFSLNGGRRSQGWVGQDTLGRSLGGTPFRGTEPKGHGGSGGKYVISIVNSGQCSSNDPDIIKRSNMNTSGHIDAKIKYPTSVFNVGCTNICSINWVKNFNPLDHSQSSHIKKLKLIKTKKCKKLYDDSTDNTNENTLAIKDKNNCGCENKTFIVINGRKIFIAKNIKNEEQKKLAAVSSGNYTEFGLMRAKCLPTPDNRKHFPMVLHHGGCDINYLTPEEAIAGGALPLDWMKFPIRGIKPPSKDTTDDTGDDDIVVPLGENLAVILYQLRLITNISNNTPGIAPKTSSPIDVNGCLTKTPGLQFWSGDMYDESGNMVGELRLFDATSDGSGNVISWEINFEQTGTVHTTGKTPYTWSHRFLGTDTNDHDFPSNEVVWELIAYRDAGDPSYDSASHTIEFTRTLTCDVPVFKSTDTVLNEQEDTAINYLIEVESVNDQIAKITILNLPDFLTFKDNRNNTATITGNPTQDEVGTYSITIISVFPSQSTAVKELTINIAAFDDLPYFVTTSLPDATEDISYNATITVEDEDNDILDVNAVDIPAWLTLTRTGNKTFSLAGVPRYDEGHIGNDKIIQLSVSDSSGGEVSRTVTKTYTINVIKVNELPVFKTTPPGADEDDLTVPININEDAVFTYNIEISDSDDSNINFEIVGSKPDWLELEKMGDFTAKLSGTPLQAHVGNQPTITIKASDESGGEITQTFTLNILNVDDSPVFTETESLPTTVQQGVLMNVTIRLSDEDPDDINAITASGVPGFLTFTDNSNNTATLVGTPKNDDVGTHTITFSSNPEYIYTFTVENVNDAPTFASVEVTEATQDVSYNYLVVIEDIDTGDDITFSLVDDTPDWLSITKINNLTARLSGTPRNDNVGSNNNVTIRAVDSGGLQVDQKFAITVANVNDAPRFTSTPNTAAMQDSPYEYQVVVVDDDVGDTVSISAPTRPPWISISETTINDAGEFTATLSGTPAQTDYDGSSNPQIILKAVDASNVSTTQEFTITISDKNDAPVFYGVYAPDQLEEDVDISVSFWVEDPDDHDISINLIDHDPTFVTLGSVSKDINNSWNSALHFTPRDEHSTSQTYTITATDNHDIPITTTHTVTVAITPVNDIPQFIALPSDEAIQVTQDQEFTKTFNLEDPDHDEVTFSFTTTPEVSWLSLDPVDGVVTKVDNLFTATLQGTPTNSDIFAVALNDGGKRIVDVTLNVADASGSATQNFQLQLENANDPPEFESSDTLTILEDVAFEHKIIVKDIDREIVTFSLTTDASWGELVLPATQVDGEPEKTEITLNLHPVDIHGGTFVFNVTANDGTTEITQNLSVTVSNVNDHVIFVTDPPNLVADTVTVNEGENFVYDIEVEDIDDTNVTFTLNSPSWLTLSTTNPVKDGNAFRTQLTGPTEFDDEHVGNHPVTITATDGSSTDVQTFTLVVNNVNDPPEFVSATSLSATQGEPYTLTIVYSDVDNNTLDISVVSKPAWLTDFTHDGSGTAIFGGTPGATDISDNELIIQVTDNIITTPIQRSFEILVSDVNDPPSFTDVSANIQIIEGAEADYTFTVVDADAGEIVSFSLEGTGLGLNFIDHGNNTVTVYFVAQQHTANKQHQYVLTATDPRGGVAIENITVTVVADNDNPVFMDLTNKDTIFVNEGAAYSRNITVEDLDTNQVTFSISSDLSSLVLTPLVVTSTAIHDSEIVLTNNSSLNYVYDGVSNKTLELIHNKVYKFVYPSSHPLRFREKVSGNVITDHRVYNVDDAAGVLYVQFTVDTPELQYYCTAHSTNMVGDVTFSSGHSFTTVLSIPENTTNDSDVGKRNVTITVEDASGGLQALDFEIDIQNINEAPTFTNPAEESIVIEEDISYPFVVEVEHEDNNDPITFSITPDDHPWVTIEPTTATTEKTATVTFDPTNDNVGNHSYKITATDGVHTIEKTVNVEVTNVNDGPIITNKISGQIDVNEDTTYSKTFTVEDIDHNRVTFSVSPLAEWYGFTNPVVDSSTNVFTAVFTATPGNDEVRVTPYELTVTVKDGSLNDTNQFNLAVINVNDHPTIITTHPGSITQGQTYEYLVKATDVDTGDSANLTYTITGLPDWLTQDPATTDEDGNKTIRIYSSSQVTQEQVQDDDYAYTIKVEDASGAYAEQTVTFKVLDENDLPIFTTTPPPTDISQNELYHYTIGASDADGTIPGIRIEPDAILPDWLSFQDNGDGTADLSGNPGNSHVGDYEFKIEAFDSVGVTKQQINITVNNVNDGPVFASTGDDILAATQGTLYQYDIVVTDIDATNTAITLEAEIKPDWLSLTNIVNSPANQLTATLSGTPANGDVGSNTVKLVATDSHDETYTKEFVIEVSNINDPPVFVSSDTITILEDAVSTHKIEVSDLDAGDTIDISLLENDSVLPATLGAVTVNDAGNTEAILTLHPDNKSDGTTHTYKIKAVDASGVEEVQDLTVNVTAYNDGPIFENLTTPDDRIFTIKEGFETSFEIEMEDKDHTELTLTAAHADSGESAPSWFNVSEPVKDADPSITFRSLITITGDTNDNDVGDTPIRLTVSDDGSDNTVVITLSVTNVNDAPVITSGDSNDVTQGNVYEYQVTATDSDAGDTLTCEFVGDHPEWLSIDTSSSSGNVVATITSTTAVGNDKVQGDAYTYTIQVTDASGASSATKTLSFKVLNENDPPEFVDGNAHTITIFEDQPYPHKIEVTDPDTDDTITISLEVNDPDLPATLGAVTVNDAGNTEAILTLNPDNQVTGSTHSFTIKATDGVGVAVEQVLTVNVTAYNNGPIFVSLPNDNTLNITEGQPTSFEIEMEDKDHTELILTAEHTESGKSVPTWFNVSPPVKDADPSNAFRSLITITGNTDDNDVGDTPIRLTVSDDGSDNTVVITLSVADELHEPTFSNGGNASITVNEDSSFNYDFTIEDDDINDIFTFSIAPDPDWATLTPIGDKQGKITFNAGNDQVENSPHKFTITAAQVGGGHTITQTLNVTVTNVNDPVTFASPPLKEAIEDVEYVYNITTQDIDHDAVITITKTTAPAWLDLSDNGDGTAVLSGTPQYADLSADQTVTITASDGIGSEVQSFTITITEKAPVITFTPTSEAFIEEVYNSGIIGVTDDGVTSNTGFDYSLDSSAPSWLQILNDGDNGKYLGGTPPAGSTVGIQSFTITVNETGKTGVTTSESFTITVKSKPRFTSTNIIIMNEDETKTHNITVVDEDNLPSPLTITHSTLPDWIDFSYNGGGNAELTLQPGNDHVTDAVDPPVVITATDGQYTTTQELAITVNNVNDAASFISTEITSVNEGDAYTYVIEVKDIDDGDTIEIVKHTPTPDWLSISGTTKKTGADHIWTATLTGTPEQAQVGTHSIDLRGIVNGNNDDYVQQLYTLTVNEVNDGPVFTSGASATAVENETTTVTISVTDEDDTNVTFSITEPSPKPGWISLTNSDGLTAELVLTPDKDVIDASSTYDIKITATDGGGATEEQTFTINVSESPITFTSNPNLTAVIGDEYSYTPAATSGDRTVTFTGTDIPDWLEFDGTTLTSKTDQPGSSDIGNGVANKVIITASDGVGTKTQEFTVDVQSRPAFTSASQIEVYLGQTTTHTFTVTDEDSSNSDISYNMTPGQAWITVPTDADPTDNAIEITIGEVPSDTSLDAPVTFQVTATDEDSNTNTQDFTIKLRKLEITSNDVTAASTGNEYSYTIVATDTDSTGSATPVISAAISGSEGSAEWLTFDGTNTLSGTPANGTADSADKTVTITVTGNAGTEDYSITRQFTITVTESNTAPEFNFTPSEIAVQDQEYKQQIVVQDAQNDQVTYTLTGPVGNWLKIMDGAGNEYVAGTAVNVGDTYYLQGTPINNDAFPTLKHTVDSDGNVTTTNEVDGSFNEPSDITATLVVTEVDSGDLSDTLTWTLIAYSIPKFSTDASASVFVNEVKRHTFDVTDINSGSTYITFAGTAEDGSSNLPSWLVLSDQFTDNVEYLDMSPTVPPVSENTSYNIIVTATNMRGYSSPQTFTINVGVSIPALTFTYDGNTENTPQALVYAGEQYNVLINSPDGVPTLTNNPASDWLELVTQGGGLSKETGEEIPTTYYLRNIGYDATIIKDYSDTYENITVSVTHASDSTATNSVSFTIQVEEPPNPVVTFGDEGSTTTNPLSVAAIDGAYSQNINVTTYDGSDYTAVLSLNTQPTDGSPWLSVDDSSSPFKLVGTPSSTDLGGYSYTLVVQDSSNILSTVSVNFTINVSNLTPQFTSAVYNKLINSENVMSAGQGETFIHEIVVQDTDSTTIEFTLDASGDWLTLDGGPGPVTVNKDDDGNFKVDLTGTPPEPADGVVTGSSPFEYPVTITATDPDGRSATQTFDVVLDRLPIIDPSFEEQYSALDENGTPFTQTTLSTLNIVDYASQANSPVIKIPAGTPAGNWSFNVIAGDPDGNVSRFQLTQVFLKIQNGSVLNYNTLYPSFIDERDNADSITNNNNYKSEFYNTDTIGDDWVGLGVYIKRLVFNPPGHGGTTATIVNLQNKLHLLFYIVANPISFTSTASVTATIGVNYEYEVATSHTDGTAVTLTISDLPDWLEFNTTTNKLTSLADRPNSDDKAANNTVTITATDGVAEKEQTFIIGVEDPAPPTVTFGADETAEPPSTTGAGILYEQSINVTTYSGGSDIAAPTLTLSSPEGGSEWLTIVNDGGNYKISGTPDAIGTYTYALVITDANNPFSTTNISFTISSNTPPSPTVTFGADTTSTPLSTIGAGILYEQSINVTTISGGSDIAAPTLTLSSPEGGSEWLTIVNDGGNYKISGTPDAIDTYTYALVITDANNSFSTKNISFTISSNTPASPTVTFGTDTTAAPLSTTGAGILYEQSINVTTISGGSDITAPTLTLSSPEGGSEWLTIVNDGGNYKISGTPDAIDTYTYALVITDANNSFSTKNISFTISSNTPAPPTVTFGTDTTAAPLSTTGAGILYEQSINVTTISGGSDITAPTLTLSSPEGGSEWLTIANDGSNYKISGTPDAIDTYAYALVITDANNSFSTKNISFTISSNTPASPTVTFGTDTTNNPKNNYTGLEYDESINVTTSPEGNAITITNLTSTDSSTDWLAVEDIDSTGTYKLSGVSQNSVDNNNTGSKTYTFTVTDSDNTFSTVDKSFTMSIQVGVQVADIGGGLAIPFADQQFDSGGVQQPSYDDLQIAANGIGNPWADGTERQDNVAVSFTVSPSAPWLEVDASLNTNNCVVVKTKPITTAAEFDEWSGAAGSSYTLGLVLRNSAISGTDNVINYDNIAFSVGSLSSAGQTYYQALGDSSTPDTPKTISVIANSNVTVTIIADDTATGIATHMGYVVKPDWLTITHTTDPDTGNPQSFSLTMTGTPASGNYDLILVRGSSAFDDTDPKLGTPVSGTVANVTDYQKFTLTASSSTSGKK